MSDARGGYRYRRPVCAGHVAGKHAVTARNILDLSMRGAERWAWIADDGCILVSESASQIPDGCVTIGGYTPDASALHVEQDVRLSVREFAERAVNERIAA